MTVIEVKPRKWGWCVFESPNVEPVFLQKDQAIGYAETRARLRTGEIRIFDSTAMLNAPPPVTPLETLCDRLQRTTSNTIGNGQICCDFCCDFAVFLGRVERFYL